VIRRANPGQGVHTHLGARAASSADGTGQNVRESIELLEGLLRVTHTSRNVSSAAPRTVDTYGEMAMKAVIRCDVMFSPAIEMPSRQDS
jgi:hypothetical protein